MTFDLWPVTYDVVNNARQVFMPATHRKFKLDPKRSLEHTFTNLGHFNFDPQLNFDSLTLIRSNQKHYYRISAIVSTYHVVKDIFENTDAQTMAIHQFQVNWPLSYEVIRYVCM